MLQPVAACCSVSQCVLYIVWIFFQENCRLQNSYRWSARAEVRRDLVCCSVLHSVLQCVAVCCIMLQCVAVCCSVLRCVAVCCSVLQCVAVCCSVLQCVAVCCSAKFVLVEGVTGCRKDFKIPNLHELEHSIHKRCRGHFWKNEKLFGKRRAFRKAPWSKP